jgi:hypothetical protein
MSLAGFEPRITELKQLQTYTLDRAATYSATCGLVPPVG